MFKPFLQYDSPTIEKANRFLDLNRGGWKGIQTMPDPELDDLLREASDMLMEAGDHEAPNTVREAFFVTREAVLAERSRRAQAKTDEFLRRNNFRAEALGALSRLSDSSTRLCELASSTADAMDHVLGSAPERTRVTRAKAEGMTDEELAAATDAQRERQRARIEHAHDVDAIESAAKAALSIAAEIRRRDAALEPVRKEAAANLEVLAEERRRRDSAAAVRERQNAMTHEELFDVIADLQRQVEEMRRG